jgi:chromosome segregation ATPase
MVKYFIKKSNGKLIQKNTSTTRKKRRNYINFQIPKIASKNKAVTRNNNIHKKTIEPLQTHQRSSKKMLAHLKTFDMEKQKQHADIKSAISAYKRIIEQLQEKIKSNNKAIDTFNETIEENFIKMNFLKGDNEEIINLFKNKMENLKKIHNDSLIKDIGMSNKLISETEANIKKLEEELDKVSKMGFTNF